MNHGLTRNDWKALWAILWRLLLLGPILMPIGLVMLFLVIGFLFGLPLLSIVLVLTGDIGWGLLIVGVWGIALRYSRGWLRKFFDGWEYAL